MNWAESLLNAYDTALLYYPNQFFTAIFLAGLVSIFLFIRSTVSLFRVSYRTLKSLDIKPYKTKSIIRALYVWDLLINSALSRLGSRVESLGHRIARELFIQKR